MKKVAIAVAVVCVMCLAGSAMARQDNSRVDPRNARQYDMRNAPVFPGRVPGPQNISGDHRGPRGDFRPGPECMGRRFDGKHRGPVFTPDMPQEIRAKVADLEKLRIDLEEAMTARPLNKEKALEVFAKMQKVEQEVDAWRFAQRLDRMEAWQKQHELNRKVPPARPGMPAPVPAPEKPEAEVAE